MSFTGLKNLQPRQKTGLILLFISLFCFSAIFLLKGYEAFQKNLLSFSQVPETEEIVDETDLPARIIISHSGIDLTVSPAEIIKGQWQVSEEGVSYLLGSGLPGHQGKMILYGHNKSHLLGPIKWLSQGEEIKIINRKGEEFLYQIIEIKTVSPNNVEILAPTDETILILYTCTGFLDRQRLVVVARLKVE